MPFFKKNAKSKRPIKRRIIRRKAAAVPVAVKSYISRTLSRNEETKFVSVDYTLSSFNSAINSSPDLIEIFPQITQGTGQANRVGNKIRPIRLEITGYVIYLADQRNDARMIGARLMCFQDKQIRCYSNTQLNYNLLNLGGTSSTYTGTAMNYITPVNKDNFTFFADKKMKIMKPYGLSNLATPGSTISISDMDSSLFQPFKIVLTQKHMPAVLQYDQAESTTYPVNFAPKLSLGYSDLLNFNPDSLVFQLAMTFCATLYYKDA